jgi:hypothetical protein
LYLLFQGLYFFIYCRPRLARESARSLSSRGTLVTITFSKDLSISCTLDKYRFIFSPRASYSPRICPTTTYESLLTSRILTPSSRATSMPEMTASYSASLLLVGKASFIANSRCSPSRFISTTPTILLLLVEDPSIPRLHHHGVQPLRGTH